MTTPAVRRTDAGPVTTLTLTRPEKLNALGAETFAQLRRHVDDVARGGGVRCLVLAAEGRSFCAGLDLTTLGSAESEDGAAWGETIDRIESLPIPTIARVQGHCLTGGLELALACDLIICTDDARFADTHARWGLVSTWGMSVRLPERIGLARAKELSLTGRTIDGTTAAKWGLATRAVRPADLDAAVGELVQELLAGSPESQRMMKALYAGPRAEERRRALAFERSLPYGLPADMGQQPAP